MPPYVTRQTLGILHFSSFLVCTRACVTHMCASSGGRGGKVYCMTAGRLITLPGNPEALKIRVKTAGHFFLLSEVRYLIIQLKWVKYFCKIKVFWDFSPEFQNQGFKQLGKIDAGNIKTLFSLEQLKCDAFFHLILLGARKGFYLQSGERERENSMRNSENLMRISHSLHNRFLTHSHERCQDKHNGTACLTTEETKQSYQKPAVLPKTPEQRRCYVH